MAIRGPAEALQNEVRRVIAEMLEGAGMLVRTPRAIGPITSITLDQVGQGIILTLALVVFRDVFGAGVGSFSNVVGAGGIGVLAGIATIGALEGRFAKEQIVAAAFVIGGMALVLTGAYLVAGRSWSRASSSGSRSRGRRSRSTRWSRNPCPTATVGASSRSTTSSTRRAPDRRGRRGDRARPAVRHDGSVIARSGWCSCCGRPCFPAGSAACPTSACCSQRGAGRGVAPRVALGRRGGAGRGRAQLARGAERRAPPMLPAVAPGRDAAGREQGEPDGNWTIDREREDEPAG